MYLFLGVSSMIILHGSMDNIPLTDECICEASVIMAKGCSSETGITVGVIIVVVCLIVVVIAIIVILHLWR